jgi:hypothetical protein
MGSLVGESLGFLGVEPLGFLGVEPIPRGRAFGLHRVGLHMVHFKLSQGTTPQGISSQGTTPQGITSQLLHSTATVFLCTSPAGSHCQCLCCCGCTALLCHPYCAMASICCSLQAALAQPDHEAASSSGKMGLEEGQGEAALTGHCNRSSGICNHSYRSL